MGDAADAGDDVAVADATGAHAATPTDSEAGHANAAADAAEIWLVATFNLVAFALPLVILGHLAGTLDGVLPGLGTVTGLVGFGYLWLLIWLSTRWVFAAGGLARSDRDETGRLLLRGTLGGALVGMGFVVGIALTIAAVNVVIDGMVDVVASAFLLLFGAAAGAIVGLIVGMLFGLVDVALYRLSGVLVPEEAA